MKLVGALLLVAAACAIGHLQAARREQRVRLLAGLIGAMDLLESHIVYGRTLMAEALRRWESSAPTSEASSWRQRG